MTQFATWRGLIESDMADIPRWSASGCPELQDAVKYVLSSTGKRLRALLVLSIVSDLNGKQDLSAAISVAAGLECMHAASLVHDDLPALDNDDMRRGKPSCHRAFSEATAILAGDLLVGAGFSCIARSGLEPTQQSRLAELLGSTWTNLCVGQALDLTRNAPDSDQNRIMALKTGALFGCATGAGALCGGLDSEATDAWVEWGTRLGVLFQRVDDVLDGDRPSSSVPELLTSREHLKRELAFLAPAARMSSFTSDLLAEIIPEELLSSSRPLD